MTRPHVLLINTHDSGRFFGCYGVDTVRTPHLDALAKTGVLFENALAVSPICSPSRGAALTGHYPQKNGLVGLVHHGFSLNEDAVHAAEYFANSGYQTHLFCFQHEAPAENWARLGYQHYHAQELPESVYPYMFKDAVGVVEAFDGFAQNYAQAEGESANKPFFAHIGFNETHTPYHFGGVAPSRKNGVTIPPYIEPNSESETHFAHLQGSIEKVDKAVGLVMESLEKNGLLKDTIIVFYSDHGVESKRDKWTLYDPGIEIPQIMRWDGGGVCGGRTLESVQSNINLLPTIFELCGLDVPEHFDGLSCAAQCQGKAEEPSPEDEAPFFGIYYNAGSRCVRTRRYKFIRNFTPEPYAPDPPVNMSGGQPVKARAMTELYDLACDPHEFNNLVEQPEYSEIAAELDAKLWAWLRDVGDPCVPKT